MKIIKFLKSKFILSAPVALLSPETYLGALSGYFLAKFLAGKESGKQGRVKSLTFNIKNRKIHFHHWLICFLILISAVYFKIMPFPQFSFGFLGGMIFQGINYPDWHKIVIKN